MSWKLAYLACWMTFWFVASSLAALGEDGGLPVVEEHYDSVWLVHETETERDWNLTRAYFVRDEKIIAERSVHDEMIWTTTPENLFVVIWDDYGVCRRHITFDKLMEIEVDRIPSSTSENHPWWCMGRRMTDLKAPQE